MQIFEGQRNFILLYLILAISSLRPLFPDCSLPCRIMNFVMGMKTSVFSSVFTDAMNDRPYIPQPGPPELMLQRLGFFSHPILYASISNPDYPVV